MFSLQTYIYIYLQIFHTFVIKTWAKNSYNLGMQKYYAIPINSGQRETALTHRNIFNIFNRRSLKWGNLTTTKRF